MVTVLRPLSTSELLDRTFHLYRNNFWVFVGIAAIPQLFVLLAQVALGAKATTGNPATMQATVWIYILFAIVAALIGHAATVIAVSDLHLERTASIRAAYSVAKASLFRVIWIAFGAVLISILIALPVLVAVGVVIGILGALGGRGGIDNVMVIRLTSVLVVLLFPLICLRWWLSWSLIVPVTVIEGTGFRATLKRSKALTKGRRLQILGVYLLIAVLITVVSWLIQAPVLLFTGVRVIRDPASIGQGAHLASLLATFISSSLVGALATIALTLFYYDQRVRKEGFDLQLMMAALQPGSQAQAATTGSTN